MGHQWMKPVIKVNKVKEDNCKEQLKQLNQEIDNRQKQIKQWKKKLFSYQQQLTNKILTPNMMASSAAYSDSIVKKIVALGKQVVDLEQQQDTIQGNMTEIAQKRILLEGLQEKQDQKELAQFMHREETMLEEASRYLRGN